MSVKEILSATCFWDGAEVWAFNMTIKPIFSVIGLVIFKSFIFKKILILGQGEVLCRKGKYW
jgi:hypothetical protein